MTRTRLLQSWSLYIQQQDVVSGTHVCLHVQVPFRFVYFTLFNTRTIHVSVILKSLSDSFYPFFHLLLFLYSFSLPSLPWKYFLQAIWVVFTQACTKKLTSKAPVVVSFPQPKYCWKLLYSPLIQSITYSLLYSQNNPKCTYTFPFLIQTDDKTR